MKGLILVTFVSLILMIVGIILGDMGAEFIGCLLLGYGAMFFSIACMLILGEVNFFGDKTEESHH